MACQSVIATKCCHEAFRRDPQIGEGHDHRIRSRTTFKRYRRGHGRNPRRALPGDQLAEAGWRAYLPDSGRRRLPGGLGRRACRLAGQPAAQRDRRADGDELRRAPGRGRDPVPARRGAGRAAARRSFSAARCSPGPAATTPLQVKAAALLGAGAVAISLTQCVIGLVLTGAATAHDVTRCADLSNMVNQLDGGKMLALAGAAACLATLGGPGRALPPGCEQPPCRSRSRSSRPATRTSHCRRRWPGLPTPPARYCSSG